jgi:hypothetical protein
MAAMGVAPLRTSVAAESEAGCPSRLFGVAAQIVRIEPPDAKLEVKAKGVSKTIGLDGLVCAGETLELPQGGPVSRVELLVQGKKQTLVPPQRFVSPNDTLGFASQALSYLSDLTQGVRSLRSPPDIPTPTAARGFTRDPVPAGQVRAMRLLEELPRQKILASTPLVLSWRDGVGPYVCQSVSEDGTVLSDTHVDKTSSWCTLPLESAKSDQVLVTDSQGQFQAWNVRIIAATEIPRPEWLPVKATPSAADQTAWAMWLWRNEDKAWRLQALRMLNDLAPTVWMAGYLRNSLLAEKEHFDD